jgi:hypothetical protein
MGATDPVRANYGLSRQSGKQFPQSMKANAAMGEYLPLKTSVPIRAHPWFLLREILSTDYSDFTDAWENVRLRRLGPPWFTFPQRFSRETKVPPAVTKVPLRPV